MNFFRLLPVILSFLLLAAHFLRYGQYPLIAFSLLIPLLLFLKKKWVPRVIQVSLALGAAEWLRTMYFFVQVRQKMEMDWQRLAIILSLVALFTLLSGLVFLNKKLKRRYQEAE
jgi:heme/copper-type cytochrome/quinol oxidase subunit 4